MSKRKSEKQEGRTEKMGKTVSFKENPIESHEPPRRHRADDDELNVPEGEEERFDEREDFSGGYKLEAFNMYDEREEGNFTEAGSYQDKSYARRREDNNRAFLRGEKIKRTVKRSVLEDDPEDDAEAGQDAWLDEYDEQVEAFAASGKQFPLAKPSMSLTELEDQVKPADQSSTKQTLLKYLEPSENVAKALRRLSKNKKPKPKGKEPAEPDPFDLVTEAADALLASGYLNVYSDSREQIEDTMKQKQKEKPEKKIPKVVEKPSVMWEYKVNDQVYGPYSNIDMFNWKQEGYFATNPVLVRKVNTEDIYSEEGEFVPCDSVDFAQFNT